MLLRCQCRTLLSRSSLNRTPYIKHYSPLYRGKRTFDPLASRSPSLSTTPRSALDPDAEAEDPEDDAQDAAFLAQATQGMESSENTEFEDGTIPDSELIERPSRRPKKGLGSMDRLLSNRELGIYSGPRARKRNFVRWMVASGAQHEFFPQSIVMDLESRRVERIRKRAEDRMFQKMNNFFNSLSEEEIREGKFITSTDNGDGRKEQRPVYPDPSPFQQIFTDVLEEDLKELESNVLKLLKQHNIRLHTQYREYINWSDYKLQKQNLYFKFPDDTESPGFRDVVSRLVDLEESISDKNEEPQRDNIFPKEGMQQGEDHEAKMPSPEELDEMLRRDMMETAQAENSKSTDDSPESPAHPVHQSSSTETTPPEANPESTSEADLDPRALKEKAKRDDLKRQNADLAYYLGRPLEPFTQFPTIHIYRHHYVNPTREPTPFPMNPTFKPWRPIPHSTRLKMFEAWRAGLGLRNVSWLGGVGWRRTDGIIGILKKEWEFVEKGGKLEYDMAEYMDALLAKTPIIGKPTYTVPGTEWTCFRIGEDEDYMEEDEHETERLKWKKKAAQLRREAADAQAEQLNQTASEDENPQEQIFNATAAVDGKVDKAKEPGDHVANSMGIEAERELVKGLDDAGIRRLIATGRIDQDMIRRLMADENLDDATIQQLILHAQLSEEMRAPDPSQPIIIFPQYPPTLEGLNLEEPDEKDKNIEKYVKYIETLNKIHALDREWEISPKEPLVEIPIRSTGQYWAIIQEMEEYSEKRAAQALEGIDGRTMTEKEEGIKMFERSFGGLRSLGGREKYKGTAPWNLNLSDAERRRRQLQVKKLSTNKPGKKYLPETITTTPTAPTSLSPAERFRRAKSTDLSARPTVVEKPKERVIWRFEDVSWVKQRTIRPRKTSFVGMLERRVQLESGQARYGPFGIGNGTIEGVGGVRHVIERGLDGKIRVGTPPKEKPRAKREIVV